jgi:hypothetical protein
LAGLQGSPKEIKRRAFEGIHGIANVDLVSAQACCLLRVVTLCNQARGYMLQRDKLVLSSKIDDRWLRSYVTTKGASGIYAARVNVSKTTWKRCLYAIIFGTTGSAIKTTIEKAPEVPDRNNWSTYRRMMRELAPLREMMRATGKLIEEYLEAPHHWRWATPIAPLRIYRNNHGKYVTNAVGSSIQWEDHQGCRPAGVKIRHLILHMLQGLEQQLISALIEDLREDGRVEPVSHQHDGLVVLGRGMDDEQVLTVVETCFRSAKRRCIVSNDSKIEAKQFSSPEDDTIDQYLSIIRQEMNTDGSTRIQRESN